MGLFELLPHIQLMTINYCAASVGGSGLVFRVTVWDFQSKCISHSLTFSFLEQWEAQCYLYLYRHGKHYNLITANVNHTGRIFQRCFNLILFV